MRPLSRFPFTAVILSVLLFPFFGCQEDSPASLLVSSPHVRLVSGPEFFIDSTFHKLHVRATVINDGDGPTAFDIALSLKLKNGSHIVDRGGIWFGTLRKGESITKQIWFVSAATPGDFSSVEQELYWYDAEGTFYK